MRPASVHSRLARLGFTETERAAGTLQTLGLSLDARDDEAAVHVIAALASSADPDLALRTLDRLAGAASHPADLLSSLRWHTGLRHRLLAVLGGSEALGEHLIRHPPDWMLLADDSVQDSIPSALGLRRAMLDAVGAPADQPLPWGSGGARAAAADEATLDALRLAYRRKLLVLAALDLAGDVEMADAAAQLADLAGGALEAALAVAAADLPADAPTVRLAVIGMGKCGGRELNYRSDVDVIFLAEPLTADEGAAMRTATALASGLMRVCSAMTRELDVFPIDANLRPEGKAGALVRTVASHEAYYQRWAHSWELQALLKARPVAGDLELGQQLLERIAPLVWTASPRPDVPQEVQRMRRRVESLLPAASAARELKLGPGGLRDIEFAVQLLQLVHGRSDSTLRSGTTLTALQALAEGGYVGLEDARQLTEAYTWLRMVEHRLQLQRLRRTHTVPADGDPDRRWLARACGYRADAVVAFDADLRRHTTVVRRLHEKLFYRPLLSAVARLPAETARLSPDAAAQRLQALGFSETRQALAHISALTSGISRRAAIQRTLLPVMLEWFAEEPDPDGGLLAFRRISDALGETPWYLRSLRDEGQVAERLARLLARSRYVGDLITRAPDAMLLLADDSALRPRSRERVQGEMLAIVRRTGSDLRADDWEAGVAAVRAVRRLELMRIAATDLLGLIELAQVRRALSGLAAATVEAALDVAMRKIEAERRGALPMRLAVIALGRLGSAEMSYASDADVLFVHEAVDGADAGDAAGAAHAVAEETRRLLALPAPDPPLRLDTGLRPEGRGGTLTATLATLTRYHQTRGQVWERQALLRAAPLAGDSPLTAAFFSIVDRLRYPDSFAVGDAAEVRRLRARVQTERVATGLRPGERWRDIKLGPGGLADVEWAAQLLQLEHACRVPGLRVTSTVRALEAALEADLLSKETARILLEGYDAASALRDAIALVTGRGGSVLPVEGRDAAAVRLVAGADVYDGAAERSIAVRTAANQVIG